MIKYIASMLLFFSVAVNAEIFPKQTPYDHRITTVKYNPENVIRVNTQIGTSTLIQLEKGEHIGAPFAGIGLGDIKAWGLDVRGYNIFLKPAAKKPDTNFTLVSNKGRTYSFVLRTSKSPHYVVKVEYEKPTPPSDLKKNYPCYDAQPNFNYIKWGDDILSPKYMWDDGRFTCLKFADNYELPVAYNVSSSGEESIIYYHFEKDTMVIHGVSSEFRLRLGKQVLGLKSNTVRPRGFNKKATTINAERVLNHGK